MSIGFSVCVRKKIDSFGNKIITPIYLSRYLHNNIVRLTINKSSWYQKIIEENVTKMFIYIYRGGMEFSDVLGSVLLCQFNK